MYGQIHSMDDVSGAKIVADKPLVVVTGSVWSSIKAPYMGDYLIEQALPLDSWAEEFYTVPSYTRTAGDVFRVFGKHSF